MLGAWQEGKRPLPGRSDSRILERERVSSGTEYSRRETRKNGEQTDRQIDGQRRGKEKEKEKRGRAEKKGKKDQERKYNNSREKERGASVAGGGGSLITGGWTRVESVDLVWFRCTVR